jgi:thiamine biosynthesis lipoprotein
MSFHDELSELSALNRLALTNQAKHVPVSQDLDYVLSFASELNRLTQGLYDITVAPSLIKSKQLPNHLAIDVKNIDSLFRLGNGNNYQCKNRVFSADKPLCIDLGGIAKGYAVDCALSKVPESIYCCINAGGDLAMNHWQNKKMQLRYAKRAKALKTVKMQNRALATSGNYYRENQSAIIKPSTKKQVRFSGSMSVFSSKVMVSDALTKAMILSSTSQKMMLAKYYNAQAIKVNSLGFIKLFY